MQNTGDHLINHWSSIMQASNLAKSIVSTALACVFASALMAQTPPAATPAPAAGKSVGATVGLLVYPAKGQSAEAQAKDDTECHGWAKTQTGYDPVAAQPAAQPAQPAAAAESDGRKRGVKARKTEDAKEQQAKQAQADAEKAKAGQQEQLGKFKSAMTLCLEGRGYSVK
jgi:hypothetical protein